MKKHILMTVVTLVMAMNTQAALFIPQGEFSCSLTYQETYDIEIKDGEDFPQFLGRLDLPRKKNVTLNFIFNEDGLKIRAKLLNPEGLPNWLLVNPSQYDNQEGYGYVDTEYKEVIYQVSWNQTWYFGSGVDITTKAFDGRVLKVDLRFNDNDSVGELHKGVKCLKK